MDESSVGERILGCAIKVHRALGPGLLESVYETCLAHELAKTGTEFKRQLALPVVYDGMTIEAGYRLDLLIADMVIVEIKAVEKITDVRRAQLLSYRLGYLLNFNVSVLREGIHRLVNGL